MENDSAQKSPRSSRTSLIKIAGSIGVSVFWVIFVWGFWDKGPEALGLNATVYLLLTGALALWLMRERGVELRENYYWIAPIILMILGIGLYNNPFLKAVTMLVLPVLGVGFYCLAFLKGGHKMRWDAKLVSRIMARALSVIAFVPMASRRFGQLFIQRRGRKDTAGRIILGATLFIIIAFTIVIPLLSSADAVFASRVDWLLEWFRDLFDSTIAFRTIFAAILSVATLSGLLAWARSLQFHETKDEDLPHIDPIVTGIVLGGILAIYLLFLWVQLEKLWVGSLPFEFAETVYLVKSGFWQLFFLSVINIVIFMLTYRRTIRPVQRILTAFTISSLLLLLSAGHRMTLYVVYYGFSYEKTFAMYTVLFCGVLFVWLLSRMFAHRRANVLKFLMVLFLWMFAVATVLPVEQFILRANVALAQLPDSRIRLYEMTMLSPDVLGTVERLRDEGKLEEVNPLYIPQGNEDIPEEVRYEMNHPDWQPWIDRQRERVGEKAWFEHTVADML